METVRILSLDGGGIRGILPARLLEELLQDTPIRTMFDMVSGTSTGGIIACGLTAPKPMTPTALKNLYVKHGGEIFSRSFLQSIWGADLLDARYSAERLEELLKENLGDAKLSEITGIDVTIPSYAIELPKARDNGETRAPLFFANWKAQGQAAAGNDMSAEENDFYLRDVCRATSAAPTYFPPADIRNIKGERFGMVDGGVFANNPAMCAYAAARRRYPQATRFIVVSLGTGFLQRPIPLDEAKGWGLVGWVRPVISVMMDGSADTVCYQIDQVCEPGDHYRFDIPLGATRQAGQGASDDFDDASRENIAQLVLLADTLVADNQDKIKHLRDRLLSLPPPPPAPELEPLIS